MFVFSLLTGLALIGFGLVEAHRDRPAYRFMAAAVLCFVITAILVPTPQDIAEAAAQEVVEQVAPEVEEALDRVSEAADGVVTIMGEVVDSVSTSEGLATLGRILDATEKRIQGDTVR